MSKPGKKSIGHDLCVGDVVVIKGECVMHENDPSDSYRRNLVRFSHTNQMLKDRSVAMVLLVSGLVSASYRSAYVISNGSCGWVCLQENECTEDVIKVHHLIEQL